MAAYFDDFESVHVGQVLTVMDEDNAVVKFLERTKGRCDFFCWPAKDDICDIETSQVYSWDFEVEMYTNDGRVWKVPDIKKLERTYERVKASK